MVGRFFVKDDTVDGENYSLMLQNFFIPEIRKLHKLRSVVFQQDGARPHFSIGIRQYLDNCFSGRQIESGGSTWWAPRPLNLTPLDFFLRSHTKNNVYKTSVKDIAKLKMKIKKEIKSISKET